MPEDLLNDFRLAVNGMPLGLSEEAVGDRLGWGSLFHKQLFADKLPYQFPDGAMLGDSDPRRLIYYVRRRREHEDRSEDRTGTLTFKNDKLVRIESQVEGIRNRSMIDCCDIP